MPDWPASTFHRVPAITTNGDRNHIQPISKICNLISGQEQVSVCLLGS